MNIIEIITKKQHNIALTPNELNYVINKFTNDEIPDYQMSAFLMAIWFNGMNDNETYALTKAMIDSGSKIDLNAIKGFKADKHSTGGVGDKVTLIYGPLVASFGIKVAKMSGKGLGITGGTIDKLESIPGFKTNLGFDEFIGNINDNGLSIISQSKNLVLADKKIYALRDVTATVDSLPLIASSIMAKKIAVGSDGIVLDIKCGKGAFMQDLKSAQKLAAAMIKISNNFNIKTSVFISNMNQPLGKTIGNAWEVQEAYQFLKNQENIDSDLLEVVLTSVALTLVQAHLFDNLVTAKQKVLDKLKTLEPLAIFEKFIVSQGGDYKTIVNFHKNYQIKNTIVIKAENSGFLFFDDCFKLGMLAIKLGAGRLSKDDILDYQAAIVLNKKNGHIIKKDEVIMTLYTNKNNIIELEILALKTFKIVNKSLVNDNIILDILI